jgi:ribose transport system permease protein
VKDFIKKHKRLLISLTPYIGLILLFLVYIALAAANAGLSEQTFKSIIEKVAVPAIVATGALFIYSIGAFDIALGAATCVACMVAAIASNASGSNASVLILVAVLIGFGIAVFDATLAAVLKLPIFITTITMLTVLNAVTQNLLTAQGGGSARIDLIDRNVISWLRNPWIQLVVLVIFLLIAMFLFNYTKFGKKNKLLGGNPIAAKQTGVNATFQTIISFVLSGGAVGLVAVVIMAKSGTYMATTASTLGMDVMMGIVFGGMPLSGGAKSRITAGAVGSVSLGLFQMILGILLESQGLIQMFQGVLFMVVVLFASLSFRTKYLQR